MAIAFSLLSLCLAGFLYMRMQAAEQQVNKLEQRLQESDHTREQLEQSLLAFADEMKESNERVLKHVSNGEHQRTEDIQPSVEERKKESLHNEIETEYTPPLPENEVETVTYEQSPQAKIITLHNQGLSSVEIAKQLNMGKGEVELFIKFQQSSK
ncbi:DUF6115 domain-containing protein [Alkalicoccobacillus porphyridii]|uniref:Helix-turn-helix domain-containing protein n=1 Tax=Alkalicoccobacillus porphyridii TaxID=2597270 RepID=A0A553ZYA9_9BACI|nr:hypothetical protein [Alkalicoccobacillus porphyridii]TSB46433.1 hypothetical protein FN960_11555 [Alkalicoccobacillus porphyridii]